MLHERALASAIFHTPPAYIYNETMSDAMETQLTPIFDSEEFIDLCTLRDILAPNDIRDVTKILDAKKLKDTRTHLEANGIVAVRAPSNGNFEVHVDLALEYVLFKNKDLKQFVTNIRNSRHGGIRTVLESTPGLFERVKTVFGDKGSFKYLYTFFLENGY